MCDFRSRFSIMNRTFKTSMAFFFSVFMQYFFSTHWAEMKKWVAFMKTFNWVLTENFGQAFKIRLLATNFFGPYFLSMLIMYIIVYNTSSFRFWFLCTLNSKLRPFFLIVLIFTGIVLQKRSLPKNFGHI